MAWSVNKVSLLCAATALAFTACGSSSSQDPAARLTRARAEIHEAVRKAFGEEVVQKARASMAPTAGEVRREHFVAPDGKKDNDGSQASPWDLASVFANPSAVRAGDVIWLAEGVYSGPFNSEFIGRRGQPIVLRALPGARAVLDSCGNGHEPEAVLTVRGEFTWFWGLEVTGCTSARAVQQSGSAPAGRPPIGIDIHTPDIKVINSVVHDAGVGVGSWRGAKRGELYGNIIYHNGWDGSDRGHGHGIYIQNEEGTKRVLNNVIFRQFGNGIHAYGEGARIDNLMIMGNVSFLNGALSSHGSLQRNILVGGNVRAKGLRLESNYTYHPWGDKRGGSNNVGYAAGVEEGSVANNYFAGPTALEGVQIGAVKFGGNYFLGSVSGIPQEPSNELVSEPPSKVNVVVLPNEWEPGRVTVVVYDWPKHESVAVDLSQTSLPIGHNLSIRNVEDLFGEPQVAEYAAEMPFLIPMTGWTAEAPKGMDKPQTAAPEFGVFVLEDAGPATD